MDQAQEKELIAKKKKWLRRYKKNLACITRLEEKLEIIDLRMTSARSPILSDMPRGGQPVTLEELISDKMEIEERIERLKIKSKRYKLETLEEIDRLDDPRYVSVLELFFIKGLSFGEIADKLTYTDRHVERLYAEGVRFLAITDD